MTIDWAHFTPWSALAGVALIGVAAALFILFKSANIKIEQARLAPADA